MKRKGFTLLELLAVIVILAIIALITIPIVLNMIEKSKKESAKRSAENYVKKVEETFAIDNMEEQKVDGTYSVNGNTMTKDSKNYVIKMKGQLPKATSTLTLDEKGGVSSGTLLVGKYTINFADGNISNISTSTVTESTSSDISELKEQIEKLNTEIATMKSSQTTQTTQITDLQTQITDLKNNQGIQEDILYSGTASATATYTLSKNISDYKYLYVFADTTKHNNVPAWASSANNSLIIDVSTLKFSGTNPSAFSQYIITQYYSSSWYYFLGFYFINNKSFYLSENYGVGFSAPRISKVVGVK